MLSATNGREAIKLAKRKSPQLIILDIMMPDMDGWTALEQLRNTKATETIPIVVLTMNPDATAQEQAQAAGASLLLAKPISAAQLVTVIRRLIPAPKNETQR
jgi:two-component system alkaline phosphatase synthesis response regulator PhoP